MNYKVFKDRIEIYNTSDFNIKHICECGQMFRYFITDNGDYIVASANKFAKVCFKNNCYIVYTDYPEYFENYFDLKFDYHKAKEELSKFKPIKKAIDAGFGIRIVNGDPLETIFEFIISANNNIKRIQKIVEKLCEAGDSVKTRFGKFKAFPSVRQLASKPIEWYNSLGAGYRATYLKETADYLLNIDIEKIKELPDDQLYKWLLSLKGIGPKVASCVLLFGFSRRKYFPVDTWVEKVYYNHFYSGDKTRKQIQDYFEDMFKDLSGLAQQYLFNMERNN